MPSNRMQGVFPILVTPFDEESRIEEDSLRRLIDFNLDAGVDGLGVALGSEVYKLTEAERGQVTRIVVDQVAGRVPVVINTGAQGTDVAVHYSRMAEENGADALMALPPSFMPAGPDQTVAYYRAISDAAPLPIFIQDVAASTISPRPGAAAGARVRMGAVYQGREHAGGGKGGGNGGGGGGPVDDLRRRGRQLI